MSLSTEIIDACFASSSDVRYAAVYLHGRLLRRSREDVRRPETDESDRYEELIVNPTLLKLLTQRGNIDCGGCHHVIVRYGPFFEFIRPIPGGHVSVSLETTTMLDVETRVLSTVIADLVTAGGSRQLRVRRPARTTADGAAAPQPAPARARTRRAS